MPIPRTEFNFPAVDWINYGVRKVGTVKTNLGDVSSQIFENWMNKLLWRCLQEWRMGNAPFPAIPLYKYVRPDGHRTGNGKFHQQQGHAGFDYADVENNPQIAGGIPDLLFDLREGGQRVIESKINNTPRLQQMNQYNLPLLLLTHSGFPNEGELRTISEHYSLILWEDVLRWIHEGPFRQANVALSQLLAAIAGPLQAHWATQLETRPELRTYVDEKVGHVDLTDIAQFYRVTTLARDPEVGFIV